MQLNTITMVIKDGQASFQGIPEGYGVHIKNYDTNISEDTYLTSEQMEASQTYKDKDGWYFSAYFSDDVEAEDNTQAELPLEAF